VLVQRGKSADFRVSLPNVTAYPIGVNKIFSLHEKIFLRSVVVFSIGMPPPPQKKPVIPPPATKRRTRSPSVDALFPRNSKILGEESATFYAASI
jgi:hypothetical protein